MPLDASRSRLSVEALSPSVTKSRPPGRRNGDDSRIRQTLTLFQHLRRAGNMDLGTSRARLPRQRATRVGHPHRHHGTAEAQRQRQHYCSLRAGRRRQQPGPAQVLRLLGILRKRKRVLTTEIVWSSDWSVPAPRIEWRGLWHSFDATTLKYGCGIGVNVHCRDSVTRPC